MRLRRLPVALLLLLLLLLLCGLGTVLSAFLDNVTTILLRTP